MDFGAIYGGYWGYEYGYLGAMRRWVLHQDYSSIVGGPFSRAYFHHCTVAVGHNHCAASTTGTVAGGVYNHASATGQPLRRGYGYELRRRGGSDDRHLPEGSPRGG